MLEDRGDFRVGMEGGKEQNGGGDESVVELAIVSGERRWEKLRS